MGGEWTSRSLASLCSYMNRGSSPSYVDSGGVLVVNQKCIRNHRVDFDEARRTNQILKPINEDRFLRRWDVLVNSTGVGTLGRVGQIFDLVEPATVDSHVTIVRPNPKVVNPHYLGIVLRAFRDQIESLAEGSTGQTELSRNRLGGMLVPVAPLPEQRAIARILGTLDDKIELNRRMSETLEAMARALFKSWFVDFDPVRAKAAGRDPGLPKDLAALFPSRLVDSELGEIPERWEVGSLGDIAHFLGGYAFKSRDWKEQGVPVVKIGSVKSGFVDLDQVSFVSEEVARGMRRYQLLPGDLLIGMTGYVGEVGLVPPTDNPPLLNQRVGKFLLEKEGTIGLAYVYCLTRQSEFKIDVKMRSHGTAQANISSEGILSVPIVLPPKPLRDIFNQSCKSLFDRLLLIFDESRSLAALRDALLPKLISGELRIKNVNSFLAKND